MLTHCKYIRAIRNTEKQRYIYAAPVNREFGGHTGKWEVFGQCGSDQWTPEIYSTRGQAIKAMSAYAKLLGWKRGSYVKSIDE